LDWGKIPTSTWGQESRVTQHQQIKENISEGMHQENKDDTGILVECPEYNYSSGALAVPL
jgi:hypothetical protein